MHPDYLVSNIVSNANNNANAIGNYNNNYYADACKTLGDNIYAAELLIRILFFRFI